MSAVLKAYNDTWIPHEIIACVSKSENREVKESSGNSDKEWCAQHWTIRKKNTQKSFFFEEKWFPFEETRNAEVKGDVRSMWKKENLD